MLAIRRRARFPGHVQAYRSTAEEAVAAGIGEGGCDIDSGPVYYDHLLDAVKGAAKRRAHFWALSRAFCRTFYHHPTRAV